MSNGDEVGEEDVFDVDRIRRLVELMKEHDLGEIDLRQSRQRIRLCRGGSQPAAPQIMYAPAPAAPAPVAPAASVAPAAAPAAPKAVEDGAHIVVVKSPMVGTYYGRPNPNSDSFVKVGSVVTPETTICIIEAMKVFNEIPAEVRGKVVEVFCSNEEAVDFGRTLFKIDTRG